MALINFKAQNHIQQVRKRGANPEVDDRATPPEVFEPLHERFGFTLDACALPHNTKLPRYFAPVSTPAASWSCMWDHPDECGWGGCADCPHKKTPPSGFDGLKQSWAGERVWCNPPFSDIRPWVEKAWHAIDAEGAELVVMLLPANRTEQAWWQELVEPHRDQPNEYLSVEFLKGRLRFICVGDGEVKPNQRPPFGCCLLIFEQVAEGEIAA